MEIEAKFYVRSFDPIKARILQLGGAQASPRQFEVNWRFDREDRQLTNSGQVLRLRQDDRSRLTYKAAGRDGLHREEIEFEVSDLQEAHAFLEALGYRPILIYQKYRETYQLDPVEIMFDELPFGSFIEIEGPSLASLKETTAILGLEWEANIPTSYLNLFYALQDALGLPFQDATFENFAGREPDLLHSIGLREAALRRGSA